MEDIKKYDYQTNIVFQTKYGEKKYIPLMVFEDFDTAELEYFRCEKYDGYKKISVLVDDIPSFNDSNKTHQCNQCNLENYVFVLYQEDDPGWLAEVYDNEQDAIKAKEELDRLHKEDDPDGKYYFPIVISKCELNTDFIGI